MTPPRIAKETAPERISGLMRASILSGSLAPGTPLREEDLTHEHGVSRHVIRDVLRRLAAEGLAEYSAFKGARVLRLSAEDVRQIYRLRRFVEGGALRACRPDHIRALATLHGQFVNAVEARDWAEAFKLDSAFHIGLVAWVDSKPLLDLETQVMQSLRIAHLVAPAFQEEGLIESVSQHAEIIVGLAAGNYEKATFELERHLTSAEDQLLRHVEGIDRKPSPRATLRLAS